MNKNTFERVVEGNKARQRNDRSVFTLFAKKL